MTKARPPAKQPPAKQPPAKVLLTYIHPGMVQTAFMESMINLLGESSANISTMSIKSGPLVGRARDIAFDQFLPLDADAICFADTDMVFEKTALDELIAADKPIVSALMYGVNAQSDTKFVAASVKDEGDRYQPPKREAMPETGVFEVDGVGMAFTLIQREVVQALYDHNPHSRPGREKFAESGWPFEATWEDDRMMGEDIAFCVRAKNLGYSSWIALDTRVGHTKSFVI